MATFQIHEDPENDLSQAKDIGNYLKLNPTKDKRSTFGILNNIHRNNSQNLPQAYQLKQQQKIFRDLKPINNNKQNLKVNDENEVPLKYTGNKNVEDSSISSDQHANSKQFQIFNDESDENLRPTESKLLAPSNLSIESESQATILPSSESLSLPPPSLSSTLSTKISIAVPQKEDNNENDYGITSTSQPQIVPSGLRQPLQEIKQDDVLTPMSIGSGGGDRLNSTGVSDLLSPMSIDRSLTGDTLQKSILKRNRRERERFFEVEEYQPDILEYLKTAELKHRPKFGYMRKQPDINYSMRTILVDWLVEVCEEYRLQTETLYLGVSYIDRFLSIMSVVRGKLQLVGTSAMFIASKYEEIYPPDVAEFVYITDKTYTKSHVLRMEQLILKVLSFDLAVPTCFTFLNSYATIINFPQNVKYLAAYLSELSLLEADPYLKYLPSIITSASIALARYMLGYPIWSNKLEKVTSYSLLDLKEIIMCLCASHQASATLLQQAIQEKYKSDRFLEVGTVPPITLDDESFDDACEKLKNYEESEENEDNNESVRKMISSLIFL